MSKVEIMNTLTRNAHKVGFKFKKYSPEILIVAGVIGTVTSAVMACKATTKLEQILEEDKNNIEKINKYVEENGYDENYAEEEKEADIRLLYAKAAVKVARLYAPSVALGAMALGAIISSNHILRKRNVALAAAYAAVTNDFKNYRSRLIERFGEELDKELRFNIKKKDIDEIVKNEDGSETVVTRTINVVDPNNYSEFARIYDDGCNGWTKDPEANLKFLKLQQNYANERLRSRGYLFLNDVYEMLGIPQTKAGYIVGWIFNEKDPVGDNFVDFGIYNINDPKAADFVNGYERNIILDFNVDGNILEMM